MSMKDTIERIEKKLDNLESMIRTGNPEELYERLIAKLGLAAGINPDRIRVSPTVFSIEDFVPKRYLMLDRKKIEPSWNPEYYQDMAAFKGKSTSFDDLFETLLEQIEDALGAEEPPPPFDVTKKVCRKW